MGLISKEVEVNLTGNDHKYYKELGYNIPKRIDKRGRVATPKNAKIIVKVKDLSNKSNVHVDWLCDGCGKVTNTTYNNYNENYVKHDGKVYCRQCSIAIKHGLTKFKSFKEWCIENNKQDILSRWNYELNNCNPSDISYKSNKKYWFKCKEHPEHMGMLRQISVLTDNKNCDFICKQCGSIAQYILDNFPNKKLEDVWDYEKNNDLNPWETFRGCSKRIWIKCQNVDYHGSYELTCNGFSGGCRCYYCCNNSGKVHPKDSLGQYVIADYGKEFLNKIWSDKNEKSSFEYTCNSDKKVWWKCVDGKHDDYQRVICKSNRFEFRCPKCRNESKESVIEEKVRLYLETLGYTILHEHECTIRPKNPKTAHYMPFDNEIKELKLIIEVHGSQHYVSDFIRNINKCSEEKAQELLHYQQLKDRYKRVYAIQNMYEYLEIPYWAINDKKDTYKKMIDNKIKEILNKNY